MTYYKQKTKTGCLLDIACTICQKPRKLIKNQVAPEYFRYNYLKYSSLGKILEANNFHLCWAETQEIKRSGRKILGINIWPTDFNDKPLHATYYDGQRVWEPFKGEFLNIDDLKIVYSLDVFPKSEITQGIHNRAMQIFNQIDDFNMKNFNMKRKNAEKKLKKYNYLKVV